MPFDDEVTEVRNIVVETDCPQKLQDASNDVDRLNRGAKVLVTDLKRKVGGVMPNSFHVIYMLAIDEQLLFLFVEIEELHHKKGFRCQGCFEEAREVIG